MADLSIDKEILNYNVSRETLRQLYDFTEILCEWNEKINLVSKNYLKEIWSRHILDSLQLIKYLPDNIHTLVDIGSGSGFPAIVLAIALAETNVTARLKLVESITKKTVYLNDVAQRLDLNNVQIINSRIENTVFKDVDVVTARAVASLDVLLSYQYKIGNAKTLGLYLKGRSFESELEKARLQWLFDCEIIANKYSDDGVILKISDLRRKK